MSIAVEDYIRAEVEADPPRLYFVDPRHEGGVMKRRMVLTPELYEEIYGTPVTQTDRKWTNRREMLKCELSFFAQGYPIQVVLQAKPEEKYPEADLRELWEGKEGVWEFRARNGDQMRLFGRVAARDWFVALLMDRRAKMPRGLWNTQIANCQAEWIARLPGFVPLIGRKTIDDYFSEARAPI